MLKLVLFDFDGVIVSDYAVHLSLMQKKYTDFTPESHHKMYDGNAVIAEEALKNRDTGFDFNAAFLASIKKMDIHPDMKAVIVTLATQYTLGIVSSGSEQGIHACLKTNEVSSSFAFVYGIETGRLKTEKFMRILEDYAAAANECIFITDTLGDIEEAHTLHIPTIAVDFGFHSRERLQQGKPYAIVSHPKEILACIETFE